MEKHSPSPALFSALIIITAIAVSSCRTTQYVPLPEVRTEYVHDTILRADSVYVAHYVLQRGDTVWMTDTVLKYLYRDKIVEVTTHDSVPYPVEVPIEVPKPIPRFYKDCTIGFWMIILGFVLYWAIRIAKALYLHR